VALGLLVLSVAVQLVVLYSPEGGGGPLFPQADKVVHLMVFLVPVALAFTSPWLSRAYGDGSGGLAFPVLRLAVCVVLIAVAAVAMGATFPVVARWYVPEASAATRDAGALYAANTVGAALGAVTAGSVLLPTYGLRTATWTGVALNLLVAAAAWHLAPRPEAPIAGRAPRDEVPVPGGGVKNSSAPGGSQHTQPPTPGGLR